MNAATARRRVGALRRRPARLAGGRVLITGASSGIGLLAARAFHARGAELLLVARGERGLAAAARAVGGERVTLLAGDVTDRAWLEPALDGALAGVGLDVLVVNAGAAAWGRFAEIPAEDFDRTVEVTLLGAVNVVRAALPALERQGGTIVATGSVAAHVPVGMLSPYVAAKHGLRGFLDTLRIELRASGSPVRVRLVHPGPVDTPFWRHVTPSGGRRPPMPPVAYRPETVADALVRAAVDGRRERIVGRLMRSTLALRSLAPGALDAVEAAGVRALARRGVPSDRRGALWEASGEGAVRADEPAT